MSPHTNNWRQRRTEHGFHAEIVTDITAWNVERKYNYSTKCISKPWMIHIYFIKYDTFLIVVWVSILSVNNICVENTTLKQNNNFLYECSNTPAAISYRAYISHLIRYSRACGSYHDFLETGCSYKETTTSRVPSG
jgi:hypothetical protein